MKFIYNKEIEELAKILCGFEKSCKVCICRRQCHVYNLATAFYNAGCRKVIDEVNDVSESS